MQPEMFLYILLGFVIGLGIVALSALIFFLVRRARRKRRVTADVRKADPADNVFPKTVPWKADEVITKTLPPDMLFDPDSVAAEQPADAVGMPAKSGEPVLRVIYETGFWESREIIV